MFEHWESVDISKLPAVKNLQGVVFTQDSGANRVGYSVNSHGIPVTLSGNVSSSIILPTGETISQTGEYSDNRAWIDLPDDAYETAGKIEVFIFLTNGSDRTTLGGIVAMVQPSMTSDIIE